MVGTKLEYLTIFHEQPSSREGKPGLSANEHGFGAGAFYEHVFIERWFELELAAALIPVGDHMVVPLELVVKKPFVVSNFLEPFLGIGPALSIVHEHETHLFAGGTVVGGTYVWFGGGLGMDVEVDYTMLSEHGLTQELVFATGPALKF